MTDDSQGSHGGPAQNVNDSQGSYGGLPVWPGTADLRAAAESLTDAIQFRIGITNRLGHQEDTIDAGIAEAMLDSVRAIEADMRKLLMDVYEQFVPEPIRVWATTIPGLATGELFPRICGVTGNPQVAVPWEWPEGAKFPVQAGDPYRRTLRQLWQWAGAGDPRTVPYSDVLGHPVTRADKLRAGKRTQLRPLLHTWSSGLLKSASPVTKEGSAKLGQPMSQRAAESRYWQVFCAEREKGQAKVHEHTCRNHKRAPYSNGCATVAHPEWGEPGSPWRPGHVLAHAHRVVQKELLRDFWRAARDT
jgi:hypothetical protein